MENGAAGTIVAAKYDRTDSSPVSELGTRPQSYPSELATLNFLENGTLPGVWIPPSELRDQRELQRLPNRAASRFRSMEAIPLPGFGGDRAWLHRG